MKINIPHKIKDIFNKGTQKAKEVASELSEQAEPKLGELKDAAAKLVEKAQPKIDEFKKGASEFAEAAEFKYEQVKQEGMKIFDKPKVEKLKDAEKRIARDFFNAQAAAGSAKTELQSLSVQKILMKKQKELNKATEEYNHFNRLQTAAQQKFNEINGL